MQPKCGQGGLRLTEAALEGDICCEGINARAWRLAQTSKVACRSRFDKYHLLNKYHECMLDRCKSSSPQLHPPSSGLSAVNVIDVGGDIC